MGTFPLDRREQYRRELFHQIAQKRPRPPQVICTLLLAPVALKVDCVQLHLYATRTRWLCLKTQESNSVTCWFFLESTSHEARSLLGAARKNQDICVVSLTGRHQLAYPM